MSPPRKRGSRATSAALQPWTPAFAGTTNNRLIFTIHLGPDTNSPAKGDRASLGIFIVELASALPGSGAPAAQSEMFGRHHRRLTLDRRRSRNRNADPRSRSAPSLPGGGISRHLPT